MSPSQGFKCSKCADIGSVQINNTVLGFFFTVGSLNLPPRSPLCETAINGEDVTGVSIIDCPQKSLGGSRDNRCVHYNGVLDISIKVNQGSSSGEGTFLKLLNDILASIAFPKINIVLKNTLNKKNPSIVDLIFFSQHSLRGNIQGLPSGIYRF